MSDFKIKCKSGSLCFYGEWFGRPYDNCHFITSYTYEDYKLIIHFNEGEVLTIFDPKGIINREDCFIVESAFEVIWQWYSYGGEKTEEKLRTYKYLVTEDKYRMEKIIQGVSKYFYPMENIAVRLVQPMKIQY